MLVRGMGVGLALLVASGASCRGENEVGDDGGSETRGESTSSTSEVEATSTTGAQEGATTDEMTTEPDLPPPSIDDCDRVDEIVRVLPELDPSDRAPRIESFIREVSYGEEGFPIVCAGRLVVVHWGEPDRALSFAGEFNGWVPDEHLLTEPVPGLGFYVGDAEADGALGLYKLVDGSAEYFADPLARRFGWDAFGEYSQVRPISDRGHHERWPAFDASVGGLTPRTVTVWVPPGLDALAELVPVIYMHDGQSLFDPHAPFGGWRVSQTLADALAAGMLPPLVVVGIDNTTDRFDEYTHVTDVINDVRVGGRADEYANFVVEGIKPFVEDRYPVSGDREHVAVMGSSLGGLVSLWIGLNHPTVFGHVASMSGTIAWGTLGASHPTIVDHYVTTPPLGLRIYLDSGGAETLGCPDHGTDNYCGNQLMAETLRTLGWSDEDDLFYRWAPGAPHNESAWAERLLPALLAWFPGDP